MKKNSLLEKSIYGKKNSNVHEDKLWKGIFDLYKSLSKIAQRNQSRTRIVAFSETQTMANIVVLAKKIFGTFMSIYRS